MSSVLRISLVFAIALMGPFVAYYFITNDGLSGPTPIFPALILIVVILGIGKIIHD
jgi:hypothetical protein